MIVFYMGAQLMDTDIEMLSLSVRSYNSLKRAGLDTIGKIIGSIESMQDLLKFRNLGKNSAVEIMQKMKEYQESLLTDIDRTVIIRRKAEKEKSQQTISLDERDISELNLSVRSYNSLKRAGINTISELENVINSGGNLREIRNLGATSEAEIIGALKLNKTL